MIETKWVSVMPWHESPPPKFKHWNEADKAKFAAMFPSAPFPELLKAFPLHTRKSLENRGARLGIKRKQRKVS
jgi:hypothetical protein